MTLCFLLQRHKRLQVVINSKYFVLVLNIEYQKENHTYQNKQNCVQILCILLLKVISVGLNNKIML